MYYVYLEAQVQATSFAMRDERAIWVIALHGAQKTRSLLYESEQYKAADCLKIISFGLKQDFKLFTTR